MDGHKKIEGNTDLIRENSSTAIINTNEDAFRMAKESKHRRAELERRTEVLEKNVSDVKALLEKILEKIDK